MSYKYSLALSSSLILSATAFIILFTDTNTDLFFSINKIGIYFPDITWILLTTLGNKPFALTLLFIVAWRKPDLLLAALIASILAGLISSSLKPLFDLARPTDVLALSSYHLIGFKITGHSFPSGHTLSAFAITASLIFYFKNRWVTVGMLILASFVGLSRIMLGVHWPIDVLMGAVLGLACGYAGVQILQLTWLKLNRFITGLLIILYFLLAIRLLWKGTSYEDVQILVKITSIVGISLGLGLFFKWCKK